MEMLHGPLGQVLTLGDRLRRGVMFDNDGPNAALPKLDGKPQPHGPAADDDHLRLLVVCVQGAFSRTAPSTWLMAQGSILAIVIR